MSQIFLLVLFLKGSSWAHCQFLSPMLMHLSSFPSLLTLGKVHLGAHVNEWLTLRTWDVLYIHKKSHCDLIITRFKYAVPETSQLYIVRAHTFTLSLCTHRGHIHTFFMAIALYTSVPHTSGMSQIFTPITLLWDMILVQVYMPVGRTHSKMWYAPFLFLSSPTPSLLI